MTQQHGLQGKQPGALTPRLVRDGSPGAQLVGWAGQYDLRVLKPSTQAAGSPQQALASYLYSWHAQDWVGMVNATQLSWRRRQSDPLQALRLAYQDMQLLGTRITQHGTPMVDVMPLPLDYITFIDMGVMVWWRSPDQLVAGSMKQLWLGRMVVRLVREGVDAKPRVLADPHGVWGVNPVSCLDQNRTVADMHYLSARPATQADDLLDDFTV